MNTKCGARVTEIVGARVISNTFKIKPVVHFNGLTPEVCYCSEIEFDSVGIIV